MQQAGGGSWWKAFCFRACAEVEDGRCGSEYHTSTWTHGPHSLVKLVITCVLFFSGACINLLLTCWKPFYPCIFPVFQIHLPILFPCFFIPQFSHYNHLSFLCFPSFLCFIFLYSKQTLKLPTSTSPIANRLRCHIGHWWLDTKVIKSLDETWYTLFWRYCNLLKLAR